MALIIDHPAREIAAVRIIKLCAVDRIAALLAQIRRALSAVCIRSRTGFKIEDAALLTAVAEAMQELRRVLAEEFTGLPAILELDRQMSLLNESIGDLYAIGFRKRR